jgi:selenocysteine lyase/cysteine desulfurase
MHAPFGTGGLIVRKDLLSTKSETLDQMRQSGDENTAGIAALGKAMQYLQRIGLDLITAKEQALVKLVLEQFRNEPRIFVAGIDDPNCQRIPCRGAVFSFEVQDIPYNLVARLLAIQGGIGLRIGCFCAHPIVKQLMHINLFRQRLADFFIEVLPKFTAKIVPGFVRVSFGLENTEADAEYLMQVLNSILTDTKSSPFGKFLSSTHNGTPWLPPFEEHTDIQKFIYQRIAMIFPVTE